MKSITAQTLILLFLTIVVSQVALAEEIPSKEQGLSIEPRLPDQDKKLFQAFGIGMYIAAAGDLASTEWALSHPQVYEQNPLMSNRGVRIAAHVLAPTAMWWTTDWMRKRGHSRSALLMRIGMTAGYGYLTVHNLRTAARY
jgi:hypothetical protein